MIPLAPYNITRAIRVLRRAWARFRSLQRIPNPIGTGRAYLIKGYTAKISAALLGLHDGTLLFYDYSAKRWITTKDGQ